MLIFNATFRLKNQRNLYPEKLSLILKASVTEYNLSELYVGKFRFIYVNSILSMHFKSAHNCEY